MTKQHSRERGAMSSSHKPGGAVPRLLQRTVKPSRGGDSGPLRQADAQPWEPDGTEDPGANADDGLMLHQTPPSRH